MKYFLIKEQLVDSELLKRWVDKVFVFEFHIENDEQFNDLISRKLIEDQIVSYCNFQWGKEEWQNFKDIIDDKIFRYAEPGGFNKNDGIILPLITYELIEDYYKLELLYLFENCGDLESNTPGFDSVFLDGNSIFMCEYKSSLSKSTDIMIANKFKEGIKSIFCNNLKNITKISLCKKNALDKNKSEIILQNLNLINKNRLDLIDMVGKTDTITFNICFISPLNDLNSDENLKRELISRLKDSDIFCGNCSKRNKGCLKYTKIKVINFIVVKLNNEFSMLDLYKSMNKYIDERLDYYE